MIIFASGYILVEVRYAPVAIMQEHIETLGREIKGEAQGRRQADTARSVMKPGNGVRFVRVSSARECNVYVFRGTNAMRMLSRPFISHLQVGGAYPTPLMWLAVCD